MALKPEEAIELVKYLGYEPDKITDLETAKTSFESDFVKKDALKDRKSDAYKEFAPHFTGAFSGSVMATVKNKLKKYGAELTADEIKDAKTEDVIEIAFSKMHSGFDTKIKELEANAGKTADEKFKTLEQELITTKSKLSDTTNALTQIKEDYSTKETSWANELKDVKKTTLEGKAFAGIKWKSNISELEKEGFLSKFKKDYKTDLDADGNLEIFASDGKRIPNPAKTSTFKSLEAVLEEEGIKQKIWSVTPQVRGPVPKFETRFGSPVGIPEPKQDRTIHPRAQ